VDEKLSALIRESEFGSFQATRAAIELTRVGRQIEAARIVRAAIARGHEPAGAVERLDPQDLDRLENRPLPACERSLRKLAWHPAEDRVFVTVDSEYGTEGSEHEILDWSFNSPPKSLLGASDIRAFLSQEPPEHDSSLLTLYEPGPLAVDQTGENLALSWRFFTRTADNQQWFRLSLSDQALQIGPTMSGTIFGWSGSEVLGLAKKSLLTWCKGHPGGASFSPKCVELDANLGTVVSRVRRKLLFYKPGCPQPIAERDYPIDLQRGKWNGMVAGWCGRAVFCDRDKHRVVACNSDSLLGEAPIPQGMPKIVSVRPAPSSMFVALRFYRKASVAILDLRRNAQRIIDLKAIPRDLVWSPSGKQLAAPSQKGLLQVISLAKS
jgi:hypothetical protein